MYDIDERVRWLKYRIEKFKRKHKHLYNNGENENEIVDTLEKVVPRTKKIVQEEPKPTSDDELSQEEINFQRALRAALKKTKKK